MPGCPAAFTLAGAAGCGAGTGATVPLPGCPPRSRLRHPGPSRPFPRQAAAHGPAPPRPPLQGSSGQRPAGQGWSDPDQSGAGLSGHGLRGRPGPALPPGGSRRGSRPGTGRRAPAPGRGTRPGPAWRY